MSFVLFTDSAANLPADVLARNNIQSVPFHYTVNGEERVAENETEQSLAEFYKKMSEQRPEIHTSMINRLTFEDYLRPYIEQGNDLLYVGMSAGISGTFREAEAAVIKLREEFPDRYIDAVDTLAASLGEGMLVLAAAKYRDDGLTAEQTARNIRRVRQQLCQFFTVDDLRYLLKGGRVRVVTAVVGTVLNIKPILRGNENGVIVRDCNVKGRKAAMKALCSKFEKYADTSVCRTIAIAHCGAESDAASLADMIKASSDIDNVMIHTYEPMTGSHVGPGTVALFFFGKDDSSRLGV